VSVGVKSVEKAVLILKILAEADEPLRLTELAQRAKMIPSMAHSYLASLERTGVIARTSPGALYELGTVALHLGLAALSRLSFRDAAKELMVELSKPDKNVLLSVWSDRGPIILDKVEGARDTIFEVRVGSTVPLVATVTGRTFMAFMPPANWQALLLEAGMTVAARNRLEREIASLAMKGVGLSHSGTPPDRPAVTAPVFDHNNELKCVITVMGDPRTFGVDAQRVVASRLREAAAELSSRLGWKAKPK
jgi:DNA-binding IclR family transcriptional regulator